MSKCPWPAVIAFLAAMGSASAAPHLIYIGTYEGNQWDATAPHGDGVYSAAFDPATGALSAPKLAAKDAGPSFLAFDPSRTHLYTSDEKDATVSAFAIDAKGGLSFINRQSSGGTLVPHLVVDATDAMLIAADYGSGFTCAFPVRADGGLGPRSAYLKHSGPLGPVQPRQMHPFPHSVTLSPDNRFALVCDLGLDRVLIYRLDPAHATLTPNAPAFVDVPAGHGVGPRHSVFSPDARSFYVVDEMGSNVCVFAYDAARGALAPSQVISTLPAGFHGKSTCAEIAVRADGRFVYASNRGHDSIAVFARDPLSGRLTFVDAVPCGGGVPRNFALSPDGAWLISANQRGCNLAVFQVDAVTGRPIPTGRSVKVPNPVCVLFNQ